MSSSRVNSSPRRSAAPAASRSSVQPLASLFPPAKSASVARRASSKSKSRSPVPSKVYVSKESSEAIQRDIYSMLNDRMLWFYLILAVVVFIAVFLLARVNHDKVHSWARLPVWLSNPFLLAIIVFLSLFLAAYSTYGGHIRATPVGRNTVGILFILVGVLFVVLAYLVYRAFNFVAAFWVSVAILVLLAIHSYSVWRVNPMAGYANIPALLLSIFLVYRLWFAAEEVQNVGECLTLIR